VPGLSLFGLAVRSAVAIGPSPVPLLQELLILALQLVVEDDAPDAPAAGPEALLRAKERAIDLGVVGQLARLSEAGIERLAWLQLALQPIGLENVSTSVREDDDVKIPAFERDPFDKPRFLEMSKVISRRSRFAFTLEHIAQIIPAHHPKRSDRRECLALRAVQLVGSLPVTHEFAVHATRQVDMAAKDAAAIIVADVCAFAAAARSTMPLV